MNEPQRVPPGWYPVGDSERYWDGIAWTAQVRASGDAHNSWAPLQDSHGLPHQPASSVTPYAQRPEQAGWPPTQWVEPGYSAAPRPVYGAAQVPGYVVAPKSPGISVLASFFLPGLGSIINGDVGKGAAILLAWVVCWVLTLIVIGVVGLFALWVVGMVDAYQGARAWNARHGILS